ncbi:hypothetical protein C8R47DRAFT_1070444 [Mycena vitilis]|nr:hypothetical protein C8R47DRAFT_1070444 [Mycena vitilis]
MLVFTFLIGTASGLGTGGQGVFHVVVSSGNGVGHHSSFPSLGVSALSGSLLFKIVRSPFTWWCLQASRPSPFKLQALWLASSTQAAHAILKQPQAINCHKIFSRPQAMFARIPSRPVKLLKTQALLRIVVFSSNQDVGCIRI